MAYKDKIKLDIQKQNCEKCIEFYEDDCVTDKNLIYSLKDTYISLPQFYLVYTKSAGYDFIYNSHKSYQYVTLH